jgi:hypothetical protein
MARQTGKRLVFIAVLLLFWVLGVIAKTKITSANSPNSTYLGKFQLFFAFENKSCFWLAAAENRAN